MPRVDADSGRHAADGFSTADGEGSAEPLQQKLEVGGVEKTDDADASDAAIANKMVRINSFVQTQQRHRARE